LQNLSENTAILFFSRTSKSEAAQKNLSVSKRQTEAVANLFIEKNIKILRGLDVPFFMISDDAQRGNSFGERLQNAFSDIFDKGFQQVIAIGNDCLDLNETHILQAIQGLKTTPSVFGATTDGGVYLLGFQKIFFKDINLENISWQTNKVFNELTQLADNQFFTLEILSDIDTSNDLVLFLKNTRHIIKSTLLSLLKIQEPKPLISVKNYIPQYLLSIKLLRAPPVAA
jgi:uncharacterized protein